MVFKAVDTFLLVHSFHSRHQKRPQFDETDSFRISDDIIIEWSHIANRKCCDLSHANLGKTYAEIKARQHTRHETCGGGILSGEARIPSWIDLVWVEN